MLTNKLTPKQAAFVQEYLVDLNATQAAIRAGYSAKTARQIGDNLLSNIVVAEKIEAAKLARQERLQVTQDDVLKMWLDLASVDYNELSQIKYVNCRYCHGIDNQYQWTPREYERACEYAESKRKPKPSCAGGLDFNHHRAPNSNCPECGGIGEERVYLADSAKLSPQARLAYQGVKSTRNGIEIITADRLKALEALSRHVSFYNDKLNIDANVEVQNISDLMDELGD